MILLLHTKQPLHICFVDNSLFDESFAISFHRDHTRVCRGFDSRVDLFEITFLNIVTNCGIIDHKLKDSYTVLAICRLYKVLTLYS